MLKKSRESCSLRSVLFVALAPSASAAYLHPVNPQLCLALNHLSLALTARGEQFEGMSVRVGKVNRPSRHPLMENGTCNGNTLLPEKRRGTLQFGILNRESEVLTRPLAAILLQHHHSRGVSSPQEDPVSTLVPQPELKTQDLAIERFGALQILNLNRYLIYAANRNHKVNLLAVRSVLSGMPRDSIGTQPRYGRARARLRGIRCAGIPHARALREAAQTCVFRRSLSSPAG